MKKKIISLILVLCFSVLLFALPSGAEGEVFVAAGNTVLPLTNAMPIKSNGVWYIDYQCFTKGTVNVSSSYNSAERILVLYTWDTTLIFDLNSTTAYTSAEKIPYKAVSFSSGGTVYVPVQFTAQMLGLEYSFISDIPLIRIKRVSDIPDNMFQYIAKNAIPDLLQAYNAQKNNEKDGQDIQNSASKKNIRLTFNISNGKNLKQILDNLSRFGKWATFFVSPSAIANCENELRRAVSGGHTIGILSSSREDIDSANEHLFDVAKTKTRLVRPPEGTRSMTKENVEALIAGGLRLWDQTYTPSGTTSSRIYNSAVTQLKSASNYAVFTLTDSDASTSALSRILRHMSDNGIGMVSINILDTPVNQISEKR
ncbi:MAG: polysaccharide deacetylase family protein [Oscillospiraceae bacterium]|nr:polysaccharide deacetylase family protein [Oscillospiraceae bacterium]